jgi:hypothetical protein
MSTSRERLARNQALYRKVNERVQDLTDDYGTTEFVCECSTTACIDIIELTNAELRTHPLRSDLVRGQAGPRH